MKKAILGKKIGMTQIFGEKGRAIPVTVIQAGPCTVVQIKQKNTDGYDSIKIGFEDISDKKISKPAKGQFTKTKITPKKFLREFRLDEITYNVGDEIKVDIFANGEFVDVTGTTKGKGFQGVIKRHGQHIGPKSHGSMYHRRPGSMGSTSTPGRVFKGKKLPGRMGTETVTIQKLEIVSVDVDKNLILIKGSVPGNKGSILRISNSVKNSK